MQTKKKKKYRDVFHTLGKCVWNRCLKVHLCVKSIYALLLGTSAPEQAVVYVFYSNHGWYNGRDGSDVLTLVPTNKDMKKCDWKRKSYTPHLGFLFRAKRTWLVWHIWYENCNKIFTCFISSLHKIIRSLKLHEKRTGEIRWHSKALEAFRTYIQMQKNLYIGRK